MSDLKWCYMKKAIRFSALTFLIFSFFLFYSCKKKPTLPAVTTAEISEISYTIASSGGTITDDGGTSILSKGVCWSTSPDPVISVNSNRGSGEGVIFKSALSGLTPDTKYYVRAYITNSVGTGYGEEISFTTLKLAVPDLTTSEISSITQTGAVSGGNVTNDNGSPVTERGICWSMLEHPTVLLSTKAKSGSGTGLFTCSIPGLSVSTKYYIRSYAVNSVGTSYGNEISFTTNPALAPVVKTEAVTSITQTTAICGGSVISDGGVPITARGICWSTTSGPTILLGTKILFGAGSTPFTVSITGLILGTVYYVRAYATNGVGTSYGSEVSFTSGPATIPEVRLTSWGSVTQSTAMINCNIPNDGGAAVTARGVCWNTSANSTVENSKITNGTGTGNYSCSLTGLAAGTKYYFRAYATNTAGTAYSFENSFTTNPPSIPLLITTSVSGIAQTTAASGGNVTSDGASAINARGVCWSTSQHPVITDFVSYAVGETGEYISPMSGLLTNTTYYLRAFATNGIGTAYGNEFSFKTLKYELIFNPGITYGTVSDNDGNDYKTIVIGDQTWMAENLRTTRYQNGETVMTTNPVTLNISGESAPKYQWTYDGNENETYIRGRLYTWYAATDNRNICPTSWHVPKDAEWTTLVTYLGGFPVAGSKMKEAGTTRWYLQDGVNDNQSGFTATPAGYRMSDGTFLGFSDGGYWWSSTEDGPAYALYRYLVGGSIIAFKGSNYASEGYSVRCTKNTAPTVTTAEVSGITQTSAISGGIVVTDGGIALPQRGVCWSKNPNPTIYDNITISGTGTGEFSCSVTGLAGGTLYYLRAFARTYLGEAYGNEMSFTTDPATLPLLATTAITGITQTFAISGGEITYDSGAPITARGICWNTSENPTILNMKTLEGTGTRTFSSSVSGLTAGTKYYVRAYATNIVGTAYGNEISFTTSPVLIPLVTTQGVYSVFQTTTQSTGYITGKGGGAITDCGVCWGSSPNPTTSNNKTSTDISSTNIYSTITGFNSNITYYVRAYATNSAGTGYGNEVSFISLFNLPGPQVTDIDGNTYNSVKIGTQIWFTENLKTTKYRNGDLIGTTSPSTLDISGEDTPKYQWAYVGNESYVSTYGRLYTLYAVTDTRNICPAGWHVPGTFDWNNLNYFLEDYTVAGSKLKEAGTSHWQSPNNGATNESGFTALPGGDRFGTGFFSGFLYSGSWWDTGGRYNSMESSVTGVMSGGSPQHGNAYSVRCIKDN